jgi:uncharacterized membrane protein
MAQSPVRRASMMRGDNSAREERQMTATPAPGSSDANPPTESQHPVNRAMIEDAPRGARIADAVTGFMGSWAFIAMQTVIVAFWIVGNVFLLFHFDPYPFILLNLAFSTQAAYAAPLILLAGNRQALRDRLTLEHAAAEADIEDAQNVELLEGDRQILERIVGLEARILQLEKSILTRLDEQRR